MAGIGGEKMVKKGMLIFASGGNTELEHLPHYLKVDCLCLAATVGIGGEKMVKKRMLIFASGDTIVVTLVASLSNG
jgi:hypothetical protein